jgi:endo-1,4-beta-D-glucanase Y
MHFFALVANDRAFFQKIMNWTQDSMLRVLPDQRVDFSLWPPHRTPAGRHHRLDTPTDPD